MQFKFIDSLPNNLDPNITLRENYERRLDYYDKLLYLIYHPVQGMGAKGFTPDQITSAVGIIEDQIEHYEDELDRI